MKRASLMIVGLMMLAGCQAGGLRVAGGEAAAVATDDSSRYLDELADTRAVSQDQAFAGVLMLLDGQAPAQSFEGRVQQLHARKVVGACWSFRPDKPLTKGQAAYMVYQMCRQKGLSGGLTLTLTGPSQRYALRELQYQRLMGQGVFYNKVSGMEFVALLTRADAFLRTGQVPETLK